jgi:hypothetical protein
MSRCQGEIPVTTKVDRPTREFVNDEAGRLGVSRAEFVRRLIEFHRMSRSGEVACEHCGEVTEIELEYL